MYHIFLPMQHSDDSRTSSHEVLLWNYIIFQWSTTLASFIQYVDKYTEGIKTTKIITICACILQKTKVFKKLLSWLNQLTENTLYKMCSETLLFPMFFLSISLRTISMEVSFPATEVADHLFHTSLLYNINSMRLGIFTRRITPMDYFT